MTSRKVLRADRSLGGVLLLLAVVVSSAEARPPSFDERLEAQGAIEDVYWRHRIWPEANPTPKPPRAAVLPDAAIRAKVENYLRLSNALQEWWHRPVTARELQAELDRMTRESRNPAMLGELFAALDDDPLWIAETLARPALVQRLARQWYANDDRFHGELERAAREALVEHSGVAALRALGILYVERSYALRPDAERSPGGGSDLVE